MGYVDPSVFGVLSQIGYILLFGLVTGFMFFFKPIVNQVKKLLGRKVEPTSEKDDSSPHSEG